MVGSLSLADFQGLETSHSDSDREPAATEMSLDAIANTAIFF
jgi:hypothetical protein